MWAFVEEDGAWRSPIAKFLSDDERAAIGEALGAKPGDFYGPENNTYFDPGAYYDPSGGMGYGNAISYPMVNWGAAGGGYGGSGYGGGGNIGDQISSQYAANQAAQGNIGAAQAQAGGVLGAAQANAGAARDVATTNAGANRDIANIGLTGTKDTNATNQNIAGINSQTQLGLGNLGLEGTKYGADQTLAGTKDTNAASLQAALAGINNQVPLANAQNAPAMLTAQTKSDLLKQLFGGGGGTLGALSGLGGSGGSGGGALGGVLSGLGLTPGQKPATPTATPFNSEQVQQNLGAGQAKIDQQIATLRNNLLQKRGGSGMSSTSLPPGLEMQLEQQGMQAGNANALNWENFANQTNNQNNLAYGGVGLNQYNQDIQNALAALGLSANAEGSLLGALT